MRSVDTMDLDFDSEVDESGKKNLSFIYLFIYLFGRSLMVKLQQYCLREEELIF